MSQPVTAAGGGNLRHHDAGSRDHRQSDDETPQIQRMADAL